MHYTRARDDKPTRRIVLVQRTPTTVQEYVVEIGAKGIKMWPLRARLARLIIGVSWDDIYHWFCNPDAEAMTPETDNEDPLYIIHLDKVPAKLRQQLLDGDWLTPARIK